MGERTMKQILANDMVRRLLNTGEELPGEERARVVDGYGEKLLRSGHSLDSVRGIVTAGIRGYERKVLRCKLEGRPLYRTAAQSMKTRQEKKLMGSRDWYRGRKR